MSVADLTGLDYSNNGGKVTMRQGATNALVRVSTARPIGHLLAQPRKSVVTLRLLRANRAQVVHKATTSAIPRPGFGSGSGAGGCAGGIMCPEYQLCGGGVQCTRQMRPLVAPSSKIWHPLVARGSHVMTLRVCSVMATGVVLVTAERRPRFIGEACRID